MAWLRSRNGVIVVLTLSLISFIARSAMEWKYVYPFFMEMSFSNVSVMLGINLLLVIAWIWALLNFSKGRKGPYRTLWGMSLMQLLYNGLMSSFIFCPTPCPTIWPVGEILIQSGTVSGLLGIFSLWSYNRSVRRYII